MHLRVSFAVAAVAAALVLAPGFARAQTGGAYDLGWHAIAGGGVVGSTGGTYRLSGLSGEPAGKMAGNGYTLGTGFWGATHALTAGVAVKPSLPRRFALYAPMPNPCAGEAQVTFDLPRAAGISLDLYDVGGRVVRHIADGSRTAGQYHVAWDGRTESGAAVAPGVYLLNFRAGGFHATRRIVHL
jgi:hypothetical protein